MSPGAPSASAARPAPGAERIALALLLAVLLGHLGCSLVGWDNPPLDGHEFRQTQTALTIRHLAREGPAGGSPLPVLGPPWDLPLEFPLYQATSAALARAAGIDPVSAARVVGLAAFYLALPALGLLAGAAGLVRRDRRLALAAIAASPLYLFYSRTVMIESTALCLAAWAAWFAVRSAAGGLGWAAAAAATGALAAMVKLPTFAVLAFGGGLLLAREWRAGLRTGAARTAPALVALALAAAAGVAWSRHADAIKAANPLAGFLASGEVAAWATGPLGLRASADFWAGIGGTLWLVGLGGAAWIAIALALAAGPAAARLRVAGLVATTLVGPLVFANVYALHDYYFYAAAPGVLVAAGLGLGRLLAAERGPLALRAGLVALLLAWGFGAYARSYFRLLPQGEARVPELSRALQAVTEPEDVLVILGQDWNPVVPYMADRRALMFPFRYDAEPAVRAAALDRLSGATVGALVVAGRDRGRAEEVAAIARRFDLTPEPVLRGPETDVHLPQARVPVAVLRAQSAGLHLHRVTPGPATLALEGLEREAGAAFPMLHPQPREIRAQFGVGVVPTEDGPALGAHPAHAVVFALPPGARRVRARFGIAPAAYGGGEGQTDGVTFAVLLIGTDGTERELFARHLRPATEPADRGDQEIDLPLPDGAAGDVVLRTGPGPAGNLDRDWAYWRRVDIR